MSAYVNLSPSPSLDPRRVCRCPPLAESGGVTELASVAAVVNTGNADQFLGKAFYFIVFAMAMLLNSSFVALVAYIAIRFACVSAAPSTQ